MNKRFTISLILITAALLMAVNVGTAQAGEIIFGTILTEPVLEGDSCTFDLGVIEEGVLVTYPVVTSSADCAGLVVGDTYELDLTKSEVIVDEIVVGTILSEESVGTTGNCIYVVELVVGGVPSTYTVEVVCGTLVVGDIYVVGKILSEEPVEGTDNCIYEVELVVDSVTTIYTVVAECGTYAIEETLTGGIMTRYVYEAASFATEVYTGGYFCQNPDAQHPHAAALAEKYEVSYQTIMRWFCKPGDNPDNPSTATNGFGNIKLAFETALAAGGTADEYLAAKEEGQGWGQIWSDLCYHGKPSEGKEQFCDPEPASDPEPIILEADESDKQHGPPDHAQNNKKPKKPKKNE